MVKVWCVRKEHPSIERREGRFHALKKVFCRDDFKIWGRKDLRGLHGHPDILIVYGSAASTAVRQKGLRGKFNVYTPSYDWTESRKRQELQEVKIGRYDLIIVDLSYWLNDIRNLHSKVHYVDMGFDPEVFKPDPNVKKKWDIAFVGNTKAFGRERQLGIIKHDLSNRRLNIRTGVNHKEYARIMQQSLIGWNQIGPTGSKLGVNYRVWEILGSGSLMLVNATDDIRATLKDRVHAVFWHNTKEMTELADYYIRRWSDRGEKIAKAGCKLAHSRFTWDHRALEYFEIIREFS